MNAKWLIALGLFAMLVLAGCPAGSDNGASNDTRSTIKVGEGGGDSGGTESTESTEGGE